MAKLEYTLKTDTLFKMLFEKNQDLLKRLVAKLLGILVEDIEEFAVTNPGIPPEELGKKFCHLDINMKVNGQLVNVEVQVEDEGDYPERSLYHWSRQYSNALNKGRVYSELPRTFVISFLAFSQFDDTDHYYSEFRPLEVTRHTLLTDRMVLQYFELPKLPDDIIDANDELKLWLLLFKADTEEEISKIEETGVPFMVQAIEAFRSISASEEFRELERLREKTRNNERAALAYARRKGKDEGRIEGRIEERQVWQGVVAEKDAAHADEVSRLLAEIERLRRANA